MIELTEAAQTVEFRLLILAFLVLTRPMASVASGDLVVVPPHVVENRAFSFMFGRAP